MKEIGKGVLAFFSGAIGFLGYYPILPAYFAVCSRGGQASLWVMIGAVAGTVVFMPFAYLLKYIFVLIVIGLSIRLFVWSNRYCDSWIAAAIAALSTCIMHYASSSFDFSNRTLWLTGLLEGVLVFGIAIGIHSLSGLPFHFNYLLALKRPVAVGRAPVLQQQTQRMESFAYAVNGLSDAFMAMSQPKETFASEEVSVLEQELTGKLCASCDGCVICWNQNRMKSLGGIRALLHAVINHSTREELLIEPYVTDCRRYNNMVEEAIQAFGRLELNYAWCNRLRENRYVIAQQLDAMAGLMEEWAKSRINVDLQHQLLLTQIAFQVKEKGLVIEDLHLYEENKRICVEGYVSTKWDGGIPMKHYLNAVEKAMNKPMRLGKDAKNILTAEPVLVTIYEDTSFYGLQGIATEKKNGSYLNGDSFSFFAMDDGNYHVCLSDGMGSGSKASQESEMVVDLLQKFIEAGFKKETAIKLMNSAMVLQGEENSFSTLDYSEIDLYTGKLEMIKIGGAATFIKRGNQVECIEEASLPAGADVRMEVESIKRQLQNGDLVVMVTDGVVEYLHVSNPRETLAEMIAGIQTDNAGVLAESILNKVLLYTGGYAMDDMTVLVTGIWEK